MVEIGSPEIWDFLQQLGARYSGIGSLYLLGGSALCLLGSARRTIDIDYTVEAPTEEVEQLRATIEALAMELKLDLEAVPIEEFIPLPGEANMRHQRVDQFGSLTVYIYDPYSIALSKVARGFETDLEDVLFMLKQNLIELELLANYINLAMPQAWDFDIDPVEFEQHLAELRRLYQGG